MVGVGDGPWDAMQQFDDCIPQRTFDNFQFVNFTKIMSANTEMRKKEAAFALAALMEVPFQYRATQGLKHLKKNVEKTFSSNILPPPLKVVEHDNNVAAAFSQTSSKSVSEDEPTEQVCAICLSNPKDMAFGCGHQTCKECGATLSTCPICRAPITIKIRLYS